MITTINDIPRGVFIGPVALRTPVVLAPLAGYTDLPFRLLCREKGASLCFSEMISCHGLVYAQKNTLDLLATLPQERPLGIQLFGSNPEIMGRAAAIVSAYPVDLIDINMGCPARKVTKKGAGVALMKDPGRARAIIAAVCASTSLPVTVKLRSGWDQNSINAPQFAAMAEASGASAVTIHARTWAQGFGGLAERRIIREVKQAVTIPVIGNGDVLSYDQGLQMMEQTGCDAVMVGRGALGNPWVFAPGKRPDTLRGRMPTIRRYLELAAGYLQPEKLLFRIKNHTTKFLTGLIGAAQLRQAINGTATIEEILLLLNRFEEGKPGVTAEPQSVSGMQEQQTAA